MKKAFCMVMFVVCCFVFGGFQGASAAEKTITLKLACTQPPQTPLGQAITKFAEVVKERTKGALLINIFWNSQLGSSTSQIEQTMMGSIDIDIDDIVFYGKYTPRAKVVDIPYLFRDTDHFQKFLKSQLFDEPREDIKAKGGLILNTKYNWIRGPYRTIIANRPIRTPDDLKGLKLRMYESKTARGAWEYLGANTVVITWAEVYLALKQGVADAVTSPISMIYSMKFTEVVKYITRTNEFEQNILVLINKKVYDGLSKDLQKTLVEVTDEIGDYYTKIVFASADEDIAKMKQEHGATYMEVDLKPWMEKARGFLNKLEQEGEIEAGLIQKIQAIR